MERAEIVEKVIAITAETLDIDANQLNESSAFKALGADSFDLLELVTAMEDEFGATMPDESLEAIATVGDAADAIEKAL